MSPDNPTGRSCGTCHACCIWLGVEALRKWPGQTCKHLDGHIPDKRCTIYAKRPTACVNYTCAWLAGFGRDDMRPDQSGVLVSCYGPEHSVSRDTKFCATIHVIDPVKAGDLTDPDSPLARMLRQLIEAGCNDARITAGANKPGQGVVHIYDGMIYQGKMLKPSGVEDFSFETTPPPLGRYMLIDERDLQKITHEGVDTGSDIPT
jgi:hypothetical protein